MKNLHNFFFPLRFRSNIKHYLILALQMLDLAHNALSCLPPSIGELCRLVQLYVRNNRLQDLPLLHSCAELTVRTFLYRTC